MSRRAAWIPAISVLLLLLASAPVRADDAKTHYQKATAHFAVGEYHDAAIEYEEAFKLKQDPAILFNAAQSFRLAGDNQKALLLYNNIIKLYPGTQYAKDSRERIEKLAQSGTSPPAAMPPATPPPATTAAPPPVTPIPPPVVAAPPAAGDHRRAPAAGRLGGGRIVPAAERKRGDAGLRALVVLGRGWGRCRRRGDRRRGHLVPRERRRLLEQPPPRQRTGALMKLFATEVRTYFARTLAVAAMIALGCSKSSPTVPTDFGVNITVDAKALAAATLNNVAFGLLVVSGAETQIKQFPVVPRDHQRPAHVPATSPRRAPRGR